ncbi:MAG TPA: MarR family transcriptional regulator [Candidatus Saccharimonadales bacterium]|nr:MarR family transcriptional regulator [Candidatus Saccharimonadales bacterium]
MGTHKQDSGLLPMLLKRSARLIDAHIDRVLKQHGIARSQYRVLYYVARFGEPTQKELIETMSVQGSTLTSIVDVLVQKGWLVRINDQRDRRSKRVKLTAAGHQLFEHIPEPARELDVVLRQQLGADAAKKLEGLLKQTIQQLES